MPQIFTSSASTNLGTPQGTYIYDIHILNASTLAAISSTDSLHIFDSATLAVKNTIPKIHNGITCLKGLDENVVLTCGRDGLVKLWDIRVGGGSESGKLGKVGKKAPFLSLAANSGYNAIAAGEELTDHTAGVVVWDIRTSGVTRHYTESHTDDVTELQFDPFAASLLLSGSTDGLVNIYDLKQVASATGDADDDEALFQVINHGSSIHHAGFIRPVAGNSDHNIFALSHDEKLTIYNLNDKSILDTPIEESADQEEDEKSMWGDVRQSLACEYVINLLPRTSGAGGTLVAGSHQQQWVDLMPFNNEWNDAVNRREDTKKGRMYGWKVVFGDGVRLEGGHGEEVVRCVRISEATRTVYTGGEDGLVKIWRGDEAISVEMPAEPELEEEEEAVDVPKPERRQKNSGKKSRTTPYTTERKK
ncbi:WD domain protein [Peziza echinospora]|nr:WD domain protein [Peziza echinospora]